MPVNTPHFGLQAFIRGDQYSATVDKRRFSLIDHHLAFLTDRIGSGVISGWDLSDEGSLVLRCSSGMGIIDRFVTQTFGYYEKSLEDNNVIYVWMRRRPNVIGSLSAYSSLEYVEYSDTVSPASPADLTVSGVTTETISLTWTANSEIDFDHYDVYFSTNGSDFEKIDETEENEYTAIDLEDDEEYYFYIKAADKTGNISSQSSTISGVTDLDITPPGDPSNVRIINNESLIQILWRLSSVGEIDFYRAYVTPVNQEGFATGDTRISETNDSRRYMQIHDLDNGQRYRIILKSVGTNGIESQGVTVLGRPEDFPGPRDVEENDITDVIGNNVISNVNLIITWSPFFDPYDSNPAVSFEIKLEEIDGSRIVESEWIEVPEGLSRQIQVYPYSNNGSIEYRPIKERTTYYVTIRSIDINGIKSPGIIGIYTTRDFVPPTAPVLLSANQQKDNSILVTWQNALFDVNHNIFTFIKKDLDTDVETVIEDAINIGASENYLVDLEYISSNTEYIFRILSVDDFGNESEEQETSYTIPDIDSLPRPDAPIKQSAQSGDLSVYLSWEQPVLGFISSYNVWRSLRKAAYTPSDFSVIATVISDNGEHTEYADIEVSNDTTYVYFVTTIDRYGKESLNPVDDDFVDYKLSVATPRRSSTLGPPADFTAQQSGSDIQLAWTTTSGQFDGYEIWRSIGNKYSFEKIRSLPPSETSYTDEDILLETSTYYYVVRKFRNEADLFITESDVNIFGSLFIGKVTTEDGEVIIDTDDVVNIENIEDPIRELTREKLDLHRHVWNNENDDRRINLGDSIEVADWTTADYRLYLTETDLSETTTYIVYLNGQRTEILHSLDKENGELTFEVRLAKGDFDYGGQSQYPFEEPPTVSIVFENLVETQKTLPKERLTSLSAQQVSVGNLQNLQIPSLNHEGRIKEKLVPKQIDMISVDEGYRFTTVDKEENLGKSTVFYDIIFDGLTDSGLAIASTSNGLLVSEDFGLTWQQRFIFPTPAVKLFYAPDLGYYFALTNRGTFISRGGSSGGFGIWGEVGGTENTKVVRDITITPGGNILCTSDLGVYLFRQNTLKNNFFWQQTPIFGPRSSEAYAILHDTHRNRVIVSNELGIFETTNEGTSWSFSDDMPDQRPIFSFFSSGSDIFAVTKNMVWRLKSGEEQFLRLATLEDHIIRKVIVWKNRLFIATNFGLLISRPDANIYEDTSLEFEVAFSQMNRKAYVSPPTSFNVIDDKMFIGTEQRLFVSERPGRISLQSELSVGVVPTIYVNGVEQKIGVRFSTSERNRYVCFDEKQPVGAKVTVANQYKIFVAQDGGWVDTNYKAAVTMYVDGRRINDGSLAENPFAEMVQILLPTYNDRNAHKVGADEAREILISQLEALLANEEVSEGKIVLTGFTKENVKNAVFSIERFLSQLHPEARVVVKVNDQGASIEVPFEIPKFRVILLSCSLNSTTIGVSGFGIYRDLETTGTPGSFNSDKPENNTSSGGSVEPGGGG